MSPAKTSVILDAAASIVIRLEQRALAAEAEAAQWKARFETLFRETALGEVTEHQLKTRHNVVIGESTTSVRCGDCTWARTNPFIPPKQEQAAA